MIDFIFAFELNNNSVFYFLLYQAANSILQSPPFPPDAIHPAVTTFGFQTTLWIEQI
jgi:hypothetical protein